MTLARPTTNTMPPRPATVRLEPPTLLVAIVSAAAWLLAGCDQAPVASEPVPVATLREASADPPAIIIPAVVKSVPIEDRFVDLGTLPEGTEPKHTFKIRNTTTKPFTITAVKKSCGCETTGVVEGSLIVPGDVLEVPYSLSKYLTGERIGRLLIRTDAEDQSFRSIQLTLRVYVQPKLWATPAEIHLSDRDEATSQQLLQVESTVPGLLDTFKDVSTNRGKIVAELAEKSPDKLVFRVYLDHDAPFGTSYDLIYVAFDHPDRPSLNIRVRASKGHPLAIIPGTLTLRPFTTGESQTRRIRIMTPTSAGEFRITKVECPEGIVVAEVPVGRRHTFDVNLTFQQPKTAMSEQFVVVRTDPSGAATLIVRYADEIATRQEKSR